MYVEKKLHSSKTDHHITSYILFTVHTNLWSTRNCNVYVCISNLRGEGSFKCANSLTVHRRRLHLLPLLDKINDDDKQQQEPSNSNDKPQVNRVFLSKLK